jgi:hypothetical protein
MLLPTVLENEQVAQGSVIQEGRFPVYLYTNH